MCAGRVYEKVLLGESDIDTTTLDALRPQTGGGTAGSSGLFEPFNTTRSTSAATNGRKSTANSETGRPSPLKEDLRNSSIQASEDDIEKFTEVTVGQSWVLPKVVGKRESAGDDDSPFHNKPKKVNGIPEQTFDDFEPFIVVPRSPRSATSYRPNLKELPMPSPGPPAGSNKKGDVFKQQKSKATPTMKKSQSVSDTDTDRRPMRIEFQEVTLKKTTMSKQEAAQLHIADYRDEAGPSSAGDPHRRPKTQGSAKKKKKKGEQTSSANTGGAFFFPTLLSTAPTINLAPVGSHVVEDDSFLYEDTSLF